MESLAKKNFRSELNNIDWDFPGDYGTEGFAAYHWYPARFVPQVPGILINYFSNPGEVILDPFCGSGTTLIEAFKFGRAIFGIDINPIAILMARAKLTPFDMDKFCVFRNALLRRVDQIAMSDKASLSNLMEIIPNYEDNCLWYHKDTLIELAIIWSAIQEQNADQYHDVALATFSAILRSSCSQQKHWGWICDNVKPRQKIYKNARKKFFNKLKEFEKSALLLKQDTSYLQDSVISASQIRLEVGDCAEVLSGIEEQSQDLVVTSPPYFNMTDYISSQRLSFLWIAADTPTLRKAEIGARYKRHRNAALEQYLDSMKEAFQNISRVLKPMHYCCVVIGESPRHKPFLTHFEKICAEVGLSIIDRISRRIPKQRSLSPILHDEEIIILKRR